jgi:hypothetical protein
MEDVLETYERPYNPQEPVICLDEKPVTLHADIRPPRPAAPGREARRDSEYERCGTANVFYAVEPKAGRHFTSPTPDRSAFELARFLCEVAMQYPAANTIHLVLDNLNTHRRKSVIDVFGEEIGGEIWSRFTVHYTPTHGSWLNQAEIEISLFARQCLGKEENSGSQDPTPGNPSLDSQDEPGSQDDQLEIRSPRWPAQVRLQEDKRIFQAVEDLETDTGLVLDSECGTNLGCRGIDAPRDATVHHSSSREANFPLTST